MHFSDGSLALFLEISNCIVEFSCTDNDLYNIFTKRLFLASTLLKKENVKPLQIFFQNEEVILPGINNERRTWSSWLCKQARNRPRDLVQLIEMLIREARKKSDMITSEVVKNCLIKFGESRLKNAQSEFNAICDQLEDITRRFRKTRYSYNELESFLKNIPSSMSICVNGQIMQPNKIESAIGILSVLYAANIMNVRIADDTKHLGFNHITFEEKNNFISMSKLDELRKYEFEIHPVFHSLIASLKHQ